MHISDLKYCHIFKNQNLNNDVVMEADDIKRKYKLAKKKLV